MLPFPHYMRQNEASNLSSIGSLEYNGVGLPYSSIAAISPNVYSIPMQEPTIRMLLHNGIGFPHSFMTGSMIQNQATIPNHDTAIMLPPRDNQIHQIPSFNSTMNPISSAVHYTPAPSHQGDMRQNVAPSTGQETIPSVLHNHSRILLLDSQSENHDNSILASRSSHFQSNNENREERICEETSTSRSGRINNDHDNVVVGSVTEQKNKKKRMRLT